MSKYDVEPNHHGAFQRVVAPLVAGLNDLVEKTQRLREDMDYLPHADSPAMAELAQEAKFAGTWGQTPVADAHSFTALYAATAENLIGSLGTLLMDEAAHVYGPVAVSRAALEACGRAAYLADDTIGVRLRIARSLSDRLYSIDETEKLGHDAAHCLARRRLILDEAQRQGFEKKSKKGQSVVSLEEYRPGSTAIVRRAFDDDELGTTVYGLWSAVVHSTLYGLTSTLAPMGTEIPGPRELRGVAISAQDARSLIRGVLLAYAQVGKLHRALFGWTSPDWEKTMLNAFRLLRSQ